MSLITEFTNSIRLYSYSEKSILLVTPPDWGKENSTTIKTFGKFGTSFKINDEKTCGWIIPKFKQEEAVAKVHSLLKCSRSSSPAESQLSEESFAFDDEDDTPKPSLLRARTLGVSMTKLQKEEEKLRDPFSLCTDLKNYMTGIFHYREKMIGTWKHYFMAGPREKVTEEVEKIMSNYNPHGYSTGINIDITSGPYRAVIMSHSMSCD